MDGSKFMHLETRYMSTDGKLFGEATSSSKIPYFRGAKRIEFLPAFPLRYHPDHEKVKKELVEYGRRFVSLNSVHHRQYEGKAFYIGKKGEVVRRYVKGRIMMDTVCFQEQNPGHPVPFVRKSSPRQSISEPSDWTGHPDSILDQLEDQDFLICGPTVLGFCLTSKALRK